MKNSLQTSTFYIQPARFAELSLSQFYQVAKLRQDVFILEQQSIYADLDDLDSEAQHFLCWSSSQANAKLMGYARYRQNAQSTVTKIERVVLAVEARGKGLGKRLMQTMLQYIHSNDPAASICLSAQIVAQAFYQALGFVAHGESYDDGGIEHITMYYGL